MLRTTLASIHDVDTVADLFDRYRVFYGQPSDLAGAKHFLSERLIHQQSVILLARQQAGSAVGFTQLYPLFSSVSMRKKYLLNDLFVLPEARRLGVGKSLLDEAKAYARATGAGALMLSTAVDNLAAQQLYRDNGWEADTQFLHFDCRL